MMSTVGESVAVSTTASSKDLLRARMVTTRENFRKHATDSGSTSVQIAIMTEKIKNLSRHAVMHKKDKASIRGFQILLSKRRKLMKYLKRTDLEEFKTVTASLDILKEASHIK
jgi:small subunit ribosomal protein S15